MIIEEMKKKIFGKDKVLVLPEGDDIRILTAAVRLHKDNLCKPLLLGEVNKIKELAKQNNLDIEGIDVLNPVEDREFENNVNKMFELRKGKNTLEDCKRLLSGRNYYAIMLLYNGLADGALGGATYSTADTIRPALQIIKTKPGCNIVSSCFALLKENSPTLIFGDCGVNVNPTSEQLCDIAISSVETARLFNVDPKVAFLSFSTKGSAKSDEVTKVATAVEMMGEKNVDFDYPTVELIDIKPPPEDEEELENELGEDGKSIQQFNEQGNANSPSEVVKNFKQRQLERKQKREEELEKQQAEMQELIQSQKPEPEAPKAPVPIPMAVPESLQ